jgi:hypothetical protein
MFTGHQYSFSKYVFLFILSFMVVIFSTTDAQARRGGGASFSGDSSIGVGISLMTANQKDLNSIIDATATNYPGTYGVKSIGSGLEIHAQYTFKFSNSMFGLVFRPSYFTQSTDGNCGTGSCSYKLTGLTFFPILRLTPLENDFIKFFMQGGLGYGKLDANISERSASASISGSAFGAMAGLGVDFCFYASHCLTVEGNLRYLPIERNTASGVGGTFSGNGFSQIANGREAEYNGSDLTTTLSGIQGVLAYTMNF